MASRLIRSSDSALLAIGLMLPLAGCGGRALEELENAGVMAASAGGAATDAGVAMVQEDAGSRWQNDDLFLNLEISSVEAACTPPIAADPLDVFYGINYGNRSDSRVNVIVAESRVVVRKETETLTWSFRVDQSGPRLEPEGVIGSIVSQGYNKLDGSGTGQGLPCDYCDAPVRLEVEVFARSENILLRDDDGYDGNPAFLRCSRE